MLSCLSKVMKYFGSNTDTYKANNILFISINPDVCDISWKAQRDGLIIAVFVLALYMFMVSVGLSLLLLYINYKGI